MKKGTIKFKSMRSGTKMQKMPLIGHQETFG